MPAPGIVCSTTGPCGTSESLWTGTRACVGRDCKPASACRAPVASLFQRAAAEIAGSGRFSLAALANLSGPDGAATLTAFTVAGIAAAARLFPAKPGTWIIAGGGAHNPHMMEGLRRVLGPDMMTAEMAGFSSDFMEAQAFAYLAVRRLRNLPATFPGTTGATEPVVGGIVTG